LAATGAPLAASAGAAPAEVSPLVVVKSVAVRGASVRVGLAVTVPFGSGTPAASACSSTFKARVRINGSSRTGSARLGAAKGGCTALVPLVLPKAYKGRTVTLIVSAKGTAAFKAFSAKRSVQLAVPTRTTPPATPTPGPAPAPSTPAPSTPTPAPTPEPTPTPGPSGPPTGDTYGLKGKWATDSPTAGPDSVFSFTVLADGTIPGIQNTGNSFKWNCGTELSPDIAYANFTFFEHALSVSQSNVISGTHTYESGKTKVTTNVNLTFAITPSDLKTGSGTIHVAGQYDYGPTGGGLRSCSSTYTFTMYRYALS
jgi:hypothetical protein